MPRFHVAQSWVPMDEFDDAAVDIEATDARRAAESFVEFRHSDLDYPTECQVRTRQFGQTETEVWDVAVATVPEATAKLAKNVAT